MAIGVTVTGAALIKIDTNQDGSSLESLGYTINGVEFTEEVFMEDVKGDQNGGDAGPPIAIQYFGEIVRVRMELSSFDSAVADKIRARLSSSTAGAIATAGTVMDGVTANYFRLLIDPTSLPINFPFAIPRGAIEYNKGTKYSRLVLDWECHSVSGTLYNATDT